MWKFLNKIKYEGYGQRNQRFNDLFLKTHTFSQQNIISSYNTLNK
jgi:hypothetical protein